jgi:hypothetical protein
MIYALAKRGAEVLVENGVLNEPELRRDRRKDIKDRYVAHLSMITNFRICMALAVRKRSDVELVPFQSESHALRDRVTIPTALGSHTYPINPDGFFGLRFPELPEGRNRAYFFLEADRSTMTGKRFLTKLLGYARWRQEGGHTRKLSIKNFRVLTVTKSEARMRNLMGLATRAGALEDALPVFWFTSENRFTPTQPPSIFAQVWETPGEPGVSQSLLP